MLFGDITSCNGESNGHKLSKKANTGNVWWFIGIVVSKKARIFWRGEGGGYP